MKSAISKYKKYVSFSLITYRTWQFPKVKGWSLGSSPGLCHDSEMKKNRGVAGSTDQMSKYLFVAQWTSLIRPAPYWTLL